MKIEKLFRTYFPVPLCELICRFLYRPLDDLVFHRAVLHWRKKEVSSIFGPISKWDVSEVTYMASAFLSDNIFNEDISEWDTSNVTSMELMFSGATSFNQPIGNWNTSKVNHMAFMFSNATSFNQPLENWNMSNVTNMIGMFFRAKSFNQSVEKWDTSKVIYQTAMFSGTLISDRLKSDRYNNSINRISPGNDNKMCCVIQ